ncbi:MAG: alpha/beta hydrolase family protein [Acetobacterium sp.]
MGTYLFLIAVAIEIALAVFCIITKSNQKKASSIIRIAVFTSFVLLAVLPIIDWSFRYYALAALLILLAVMGAVNLFLKKEEKRTYRQARIVLKAIGMTALIFIVTLPAIIFPQNKVVVAATGDYQVSTANYTYTDTSRIESYTDTGENRKLNVEMWYPENADGQYPLVVFSHGAFGVKSSNESLYNELASHGYVVCSIDHTYQCFDTTDKDGNTIVIDMGYMAECSAEDARSNRQQSYEYYQKWMKIRTDDINFVIDYILSEAKNNDPDPAYKLVDQAKIGVMGHSLGGAAALGIGRMREDVGAVIALESPFMCDIVGVENGEFVFKDDIYPVPVLNVYSDSSWSILGDRPQYAENYGLLSGNTNPTAFNVYISGIGHLGLTDFALTSPLLADIFSGMKSTTDTKYCLKTINKVCLEFFNTYLKGDGEFTSGGMY